MTKLYCDTSNLIDIRNCIKKYNISGVTTNPSIMRKEGVKKYKVNSTPTIIINEEKFEKTINFKNIKKIIEKLI